jgi:hypothetical protein
VYKGTSPGGGSTLLRSYNSRKEPPPEFACTIWQAGRATCATALAFKPIQIGQSQFIDEGAGKYNPSPQILDEAVVNEWPGRELGVFVSIGTGKRPPSASSRVNQHEWWEGFMGGSIGDFAEARRRLIAKIEGCEDTHQYMMREHLPTRGINPENYYRFNVEVGVGEFGMNEWQRLADISTSTRLYLSKPDVKRMNEDAATKLAKIERSKRRHSHSTVRMEQNGYNRATTVGDLPSLTEPLAVELPGDEGRVFENPRANDMHNNRYSEIPSSADKFSVVSPLESTPTSAFGSPSFRRSAEFTAGDDQNLSVSSMAPSPRRSYESQGREGQAPPLPPKTPMPGLGSPISARPSVPFQGLPPTSASRPNVSHKLPYPDDDGPPPMVNRAGKPEFRPR